MNPTENWSLMTEQPVSIPAMERSLTRIATLGRPLSRRYTNTPRAAISRRPER